MKNWIEHDGSDRPVALNVGVQLRYRGPIDPAKGVRICAARAGRMNWSHDGGDDDIIAYRIVEEEA